MKLAPHLSFSLRQILRIRAKCSHILCQNIKKRSTAQLSILFSSETTRAWPLESHWHFCGDTSVFQAPTRMMTLLSHAFLVQSPKTFYIPLTNSMVWLVTAIDPFLVPTSGYFSIAVTKYHDQGNLQRKCFICCSWFQRMRVHDYHGRERGSRQAVMVLEL